MSDQTCAKCGREIGDDEQPWTVTGECSDDSGGTSNESVLVCEDCYEDLDRP